MIIILGVMILNFIKIDIPIAPSLLGKLTTFFQMFTIFGVLLELSFVSIIWNIAVIFTISSGIGYIIRGVGSLNVADSSTN